MGMTVRLWHDHVCHESDWNDTLPWPCPRSARQGPDEMGELDPVEETGRKTMIRP